MFNLPPTGLNAIDPAKKKEPIKFPTENNVPKEEQEPNNGSIFDKLKE